MYLGHVVETVQIAYGHRQRGLLAKGHGPHHRDHFILRRVLASGILGPGSAEVDGTAQSVEQLCRCL